SFLNFEQVTKSTFEKSDKLIEMKSPPENEVIQLLQNYNCAAIKTAPLPFIFFKHKKNNLKESWQIAFEKEKKLKTY
ncbi:MAG: hypothetical protein WC839_04225, partial [Candidatus Paceibacterota bacterium]